MKAGRYGLIVPAVLFFYLLVSGYKIINPLPLTYDPALHAGIARYIIPSNIIPASWEPLADVGYTYPPLYHWAAFLFSLSGIETYKTVIFMGLLLYALFPVVYYLYGSYFGKVEAILFSFFGAVQASLTEVFAAGEYPQLLSMLLALFVFYFIIKNSYLKAGITLGLILLTHSFTAVYIIFILAIYLLTSTGIKKAVPAGKIAILFAAAMIISAAWIPKYLQIADNAINHRWENTIWYYKAGFVGLENINDVFFSLSPGSRIGLIMLSLASAGIMHAYRKKLHLQLVVFSFTLLFTIFHVPGTQYKFPDMLALATPPLAAFGAIMLSKEIKRMKNAAGMSLIVFLAAFLVMNPYVNATNIRNCCVSKDIPNHAQFELARWLDNNDTGRYVLMADGNYETWFALIAGKYPLNPRVSELEVFTDFYRQRLDDREKIISEIGNGSDPTKLLRRWDVAYLVTERNLNSAYFRVIREENGTKLYKHYP